MSFKLLTCCICILTICAVCNAQSWQNPGFEIDSSGHRLLVDTVNDELYISTYFEKLSANHLPGALKWDGNSLDTLKGYFNSSWSMALAKYKDKFYFGSASSGFIHILTSWNGSSWTTVPDTSNIVSGIQISSLCEYNDKLFVAGAYSLFGQTTYLSTYNNLNWNQLNNNKELAGNITSSVVFDDNLYLGGSNLSFDTNVTSNVVYWNDTTFASLNIASENCAISDFSVHRDTLFCSTYCGNIYKLNSQKWDHVLNVDSTITSLKSFEEYLIFAGNFSKTNTENIKDIGFYRNGIVGAIGTGTNGHINDIDIYKNKIYIVGRFSKVGQTEVVNIAYWDSPLGIEDKSQLSSSWKVYPNPVKDELHFNLNNSGLYLNPVNVMITNVNGNVQAEFSIIESTLSYSTTNLTKGIYIVRLTNSLESKVFRIVKM